MLAKLLGVIGRCRLKVDPEEVLGGRRVVVSPVRRGPSPATLRELGARDVLVLTTTGSAEAERCGDHVRKRSTRQADVRKNNCNVALLHGRSGFSLSQKHYFERFDYMLVADNWTAVAALPGLLRYIRRKYLVSKGTLTLPLEGGGARTYLVFESPYVSQDNRKQYGPAGLSPVEILRTLDGLDYVLLRWLEVVEAGELEGDMDLLVSSSSVEELKERFGQVVGTFPMDIYTDDGSGGHFYKRAPYYKPSMGRRILDSASLSEQCGIRVASPLWRYLSYGYHLLFHSKTQRVEPGMEVINGGTFHSPHYFDELKVRAEAVGEEVPATFTALEERLRKGDAFPSLDLIGFYTRKNPFLNERYFSGKSAKPGLATFFVRDFGGGVDNVPEIRGHLEQRFRIVAEGPVSEAMHERVIGGVRGGNWTDPQAKDGRAEPIYWFVCWDENPEPPTGKVKKKHPFLDNANIRLKDLIRKELGPGGAKLPPIVHSSDNTMEALDHLECLGLAADPAVLALDLGASPPGGGSDQA